MFETYFLLFIYLFLFCFIFYKFNLIFIEIECFVVGLSLGNDILGGILFKEYEG